MKHLSASLLLLAGILTSPSTCQDNGPAHITYGSTPQSILRIDNGTSGPAVEEVHYYYDQWPIGIAAASDGRLFASYTRGEYDYTLGVIKNKTAESPFPPSGPVQNLPSDSLNTSWNSIPFGIADKQGLNSVQALYITPETPSRPETLWVLDTGRPTIKNEKGNPVQVYAQPGGPKVLGINITAHNDSVYATYTFPPDVHYPDSYMNDLRFDLRSQLSGTGGEGIAYIVDSSDEGRPGFIMLDLATGESWRRLEGDKSVLRVPWNIPSYLSRPFYYREPGSPISSLREGNDGLQISADGSRMYYSPLTSTVLYSVPTLNLRARDDDPLAELAVHGNVSDHGQRGADANGFEGDDQGRIYMCMPTESSIYYYDPRDLQTHGWVRDPRILWPDGASVGEDGYIYWNINQLFFQPNWNNGVDGRVHPGAILRSKLPQGAGKIKLA
ncbi:MAG: hypothetical protein M1831_003162 [Alyxoria varia]|nr:MAG: hypothetical protein M1831_003162 [Alyxoria varia]